MFRHILVGAILTVSALSVVVGTAVADGPCETGMPAGVRYNACVLQDSSGTFSSNNLPWYCSGTSTYTSKYNTNTPVNVNVASPANNVPLVGVQATQGTYESKSKSQYNCNSSFLAGSFNNHANNYGRYTYIGTYGLVNAGLSQGSYGYDSSCNTSFVQYDSNWYGSCHAGTRDNGAGNSTCVCAFTYATSVPGVVSGPTSAGVSQSEHKRDYYSGGCSGNLNPYSRHCSDTRHVESSNSTNAFANAAGASVWGGQRAHSLDYTYSSYFYSIWGSGSYYTATKTSFKHTGAELNTAQTGKVFAGQTSTNGSPCRTMVGGQDVAGCAVEVQYIAYSMPQIPDFPAPPV